MHNRSEGFLSYTEKETLLHQQQQPIEMNPLYSMAVLLKLILELLLAQKIYHFAT